MSKEIKVPTLPESVTDATVAKWYKKEGETVTRDEHLVDLETDKVMLEVPAPFDGVVKQIAAKEGTVVQADQLLALLEPKDLSLAPAAQPNNSQQKTSTASVQETPTQKTPPPSGPASRRLASEKGVELHDVAGSGKDGRITKSDVLQHKTEQNKQPASPQPAGHPKAHPETAQNQQTSKQSTERRDKRVPLSRIRARIAERLVQVQHEAAILTTFNEINLQAVMDLRQNYRELFEKKHQVRLGFMSFFTKASIEALKRFPMVNASLDNNDLVYHEYYDIGMAIGTERGLVVPIIRNAETLSMADIEKQIRNFASRAQQGQLTLDELSGGTFTITNGGTYGSLLSTPIINPPQTAILGMHKIADRPVVENGTIVIRPMMFVALSYDHRVIDGREAVLFLSTIKDLLEDPARLLLDV